MPTAKAETSPHAGKGLYRKLSEITGKLAHIQKKGFNKAQNYAFAREADVAAEASKLFAEYHIFLAQGVRSHKMEPLYQTSRGGTMYLCEVVMGFQFIDGEDKSDRTEIVEFVGHGADTGDKGIYKAMTGAEKYFLMKTFLISTGDDPEADEKVDKEAAAAAAADGSRIKGGKASAGTKRGGKTDGPSAAQTAEIKRLIKEKGMTPATLLIAVAEALDVPASPGADPKDVLAALSGEEMGKVIRYISEMVELVVDEPGNDGGEETPVPAAEGEQEALDIV